MYYIETILSQTVPLGVAGFEPTTLPSSKRDELTGPRYLGQFIYFAGSFSVFGNDFSMI